MQNYLATTHNKASLALRWDAQPSGALHLGTAACSGRWPGLSVLRTRRNRLIAPYFGFALLFFSCGAAASAGHVQSQLVWLLALLIICALPVIVLNISLHAEIRRVEPTAGSSGLKEALVSSLLFTPIEAALVLPAINLAIATRILRRGEPPPGKPRQQGRTNARPCSRL